MTVQVLRCETCGASEPLSRVAQRDGWYRCRYCETPRATPVSPFEVFEGPDSSVVLLSGEGKNEFVLPAGNLLGTRALVMGLFIVWNLAAMFAGIFQLNPPESALYRFGPPAMVVVVIIGTAILLRWRFSTQHLVVEKRFVEAFRDWNNRRWHATRFPFRTEGPSVEILEKSATDASDTGRKLEVGNGEQGVVRLNCSGEQEAHWLAAMIRQGLKDEDDVSRCPGCGAPLGVSLADHGEGSITCMYCDAGFVVDAQGVRWGPVRLPQEKHDYDLPPHYVRTRDRDGGVDFEILPRQAGFRIFYAAGLAANTVFFGGFAGAILFWLAPEALAEGVAPAFVTWLALAAVMFAFLAGFTAIASANIMWGTERVRLTEGAVEHAWLLFGRPVPGWLQLGGWKTYQRLLTDNEERAKVNIFSGFTHALHRSIALMRLTEVRFFQDDWGTVAELVSPARTLRLTWDLRDYSDKWLRDQLVDGIEKRLEELGREVEVASDAPSAP